MRGIGRQCPPAQLILHQCCSRCLALCVMRNLAVKWQQHLKLSFCAHYVNITVDTGGKEHASSHGPCVRYMRVLQSRCTLNYAGGIISF